MTHVQDNDIFCFSSSFSFITFATDDLSIKLKFFTRALNSMQQKRSYYDIPINRTTEEFGVFYVLFPASSVGYFQVSILSHIDSNNNLCSFSCARGEDTSVNMRAVTLNAA